MTRWTIALCVAVGTGLAATSAAEAGWLTARGDARRTGFSDASGSITTPGIRWRYYLGGSVDQRTMRAVAGTAAAGSDDLVYLAASSRVEARRPDDVVVWRSALDGADAVLGVTDLDGDGIREVVAASRFSGRAFVFDAATGALRWTTPPGRYKQIGVAYLRDVDGDGLDDLYLSDWGTFAHTESRWADVWTFAGSLSSPAHPVAIDMITRDYDRAETEAWADIDGDGRAELIAFGVRTVYVYSSVDGALVASGDIGPVPWSQAQTIVVNVDPATDPGDELALFTNVGSTGGYTRRQAIVIDVDGNAVTVRWEHGVADPTTDRHSFGGESVADVDGDGAADVVSSFYTAATDTWTTYARRGADGSTIVSLPGELVGATDVDDDGAAEILTRPGPGLSGATAWDVVGPIAMVKWSRADAQWLQETDPVAETRQSLAGRTLMMDVDGDGKREVIVQARSTGTWFVRAFDLRATNPSAKATYPLSPGATLLTAQRRVLEGGERLLVARSDGYLAILDHGLAPINEWHYPGGVVPGMRIGGFLPGWRGITSGTLAGDLLGDAADDLVVRDSRGALVALDVSGTTISNPPNPSWAVFGQRWYPTLADVTGDGVPEVCTGDLGQVVARSGATGDALWSAPVTGDIGHLTGADIDGDGRSEVAYLSYDAPSNDQVFGVLTASGAAAWPAEVRFASSGRGSFAFAPLNGDGVDDAVVQFGSYMRTIDGATGAVIQHDYTGILSMAPILADVDGNGDLEIMSSGFLDYFTVYDLDADGRYTARPGIVNLPSTEWAAYQYGALVRCPSGPRFFFAGQNSSHLRAIDPSAVAPVLDAYLAGGVAYASAADVPASEAPAFLGNVNAVASLGDDGQARLLVNSADGYLYALRACATSPADLIDWRVELGTMVGEPIPADVDDDGQIEIVVATADGYLYAIDDAPTPSPRRVGEVASAGQLATSELDELDVSGGLVVEWEPAVDAVGYEVAVFDGVGAAVTSPTFVAVGAATSTVLHDLALQADLPYFTVVRAVAAAGTRSFETISDGFRVEPGTVAWPGVPDGTVDDGRDDHGGCSTTSGGAGALVGLALAGLVRRRRR